MALLRVCNGAHPIARVIGVCAFTLGLPRVRGLSFDETGATPSIEWKWGWRRVEAKEIMNPMVPRGDAAADFITHPRSARWQPPYLTPVRV